MQELCSLLLLWWFEYYICEHTSTFIKIQCSNRKYCFCCFISFMFIYICQKKPLSPEITHFLSLLFPKMSRCKLWCGCFFLPLNTKNKCDDVINQSQYIHMLFVQYQYNLLHIAIKISDNRHTITKYLLQGRNVHVTKIISFYYVIQYEWKDDTCMLN